MTENKAIVLASDHAGFALKQAVKKHLDEKGMAYRDLGCYDEQSCDYPDYAHALGRAIDSGEADCGIAICGTGEGMAMALNKHPHVRAGLCWMPEIAHMTRQHNNSNVLVMPGRYISAGEAAAVVDEFFSTEFEGGRHQRRIDKIPL